MMKQSLARIMRSPAFQPMWEKLYHLAKIGMNYWGGSSIAESGERYAMDFVKKELSDGREGVVFDVGANLGQYASELIDRFPDREIHSFEPSAKTILRLNETVATALKNGRIKTHNLGFGSKAETLTLYAEGDFAATASIHGAVGRDVEKLVQEQIKIERLDEFCDANSIDRIAFLKIDVEGHELEALKGAKGMIEEDRVDFIQFEFGEFHMDAQCYFRDFWQLLTPRYSIYRILPKGLRKIDHYSTNHEVFNTINYLAIHN
ncbi:MAG: FkbM family methyltransferase [Bacteroidia bacterium]|jgi:FkbM family methyltransferase